MASSDGRLSWGRRLGYGAGDFGLVLSWQLAAIFLLFFSTEVVGLDPALAGALVLAGLIFDGVTDVGMGVIADRMRRRLGGYRVWLLIGAPLLAAATALLFWVPPFQGMELIAAVIAIQLTFRLAYTIVAIPYGSLSSSMTQDSRERGTLVGIRQAFATSATLVVALSAQPLVGALGQGNQQQGFFLAALVFGGLGAILILLAWASVRGAEREIPAEEPSYSISELSRLVMANGAFLRVAACLLCYALCSTIVVTGAPYYFSYVRNEPETLGASLGVLIGGVVIFLPVWIVISGWIGKRATWIVGAVWSSVALAALSQMTAAPLPEFLIAMALASFGFAAVQMTSFSMLPDTVEYGEWRSGVKVEAALYSALILAQKIAAGVAAWGVGVTLSAAGHTADTPLSGEAAQLFGLLMFAVPSGVILLSLIPVWGYPISSAYHAKLVEELDARR